MWDFLDGRHSCYKSYPEIVQCGSVFWRRAPYNMLGYTIKGILASWRHILSQSLIVACILAVRGDTMLLVTVPNDWIPCIAGPEGDWRYLTNGDERWYQILTWLSADNLSMWSCVQIRYGLWWSEMTVEPLSVSCSTWYYIYLHACARHIDPCFPF